MHVLHDRLLLSGFGRGGEWRRDQVLPRGGPAAVITTLWVLRFDPVSREAYLAQVHPWVSPDEVRENTGGALPVSTQLAVTPPSPARRTGADPGV